MRVRIRRVLAFAVLVSVSLCATACNTFYFEISPGRSVEEKHDRKAYFLWGLAPTRRVDVSDECPEGVAAIREQTTFGDGLLRWITIGIYSPRSTTYYCLGGSQS